METARPGPPDALTATRDPSNHELVRITWSPPVDPGSHPITSYGVFVNGVPLAPTGETSVEVILRSTVAWEIQVFANNLVGQSPLPASMSLPAG